jgi:hypothetical protein
MAGADAGKLAPYGTQMITSNTWFEGNVEARPGTIFTAQNINGNGGTPTVATAAGAGSTASISSQKGHDLGGSFVLASAGTGQAQGVVATVTFAQLLNASPASVIVDCVDTTATAPINLGAASLTASGFSVIGPALTAAHNYLICYQVIAS